MEDKEITAVQQISTEDIKNHIYTIRGVQVMLDRDIAQLYGVETRRVNEQVKRNINFFFLSHNKTSYGTSTKILP